MPMFAARVKPRLRSLRIDVTRLEPSPSSHSTVPSVLPLSTITTRQAGWSVSSSNASMHRFV